MICTDGSWGGRGRSRLTLARRVSRKSPVRTMICTDSSRSGTRRSDLGRRMRVSRTAVTLQTSTLPDGVAHADITLGQHSVVLALSVVVVLALPVGTLSHVEVVQGRARI